MFNKSLDNTRVTRRVLLKERKVGLRNKMPKMWGGNRWRPSGNSNFKRLQPKKTVKHRAHALNRGEAWKNNNNNHSNNKHTNRNKNNNMKNPY